jgi:hypothetical protein
MKNENAVAANNNYLMQRKREIWLRKLPLVIDPASSQPTLISSFLLHSFILSLRSAGGVGIIGEFIKFAH